MLLLVSIVKGLSEILALSLIGQGLLWLVAGAARETNFVYKMFAAVTHPLMWLARRIVPRFVLDRHIWLVAVLLVLVLWIVAGQQKLKYCITEGSASPLCEQVVQAVKERSTR